MRRPKIRSAGASPGVRAGIAAASLAVLGCFGAAAGLASTSDASEAGAQEQLVLRAER